VVNITKKQIRIQRIKLITKDLFQLDFLSKSIPFLMGTFIFFNPFPHTTAIKEICYYLSVLIVTILILSKKIDFTFKTPLLLPFGIFIFWSFLSIFWAINVENSIHDFYSHLIRYVILYYILINFFKSERQLLNLSWIIIVSSSIFILGGLIYYYVIVGVKISERFGTGLFIQTPVNIIGAISVFGISLSINLYYIESYMYQKLILGSSIIVLLVGILLSNTRSTMLGLFLMIIVLFFDNRKLMFGLIGAIFIIMTILPIKNRLFFVGGRGLLKNNRFIVTYKIAIEVLKEHPIIGIGFGMQAYENIDLKKFKKELPKKYRRRNIVTNPHNMILDIAVRLGIVGLSFFLYIIFVFIKMCWDIIRAGKEGIMRKWGRCLLAAFISVFTIGLFQPIFSHMPEVIFCTILSMTSIIWRFNQDVIQGFEQN
jgi:O-antigen ligase